MPDEIAQAMQCAEYISVGKTSGPDKDLYFKISRKGACNIPGCIIGFSVLDSMSYGLFHSDHHIVHGFEELGVSLPKLALQR